MNPNRVKEILEYIKGSPETMDYGRWGALNQEQRKIIKELCNSWLILDEATNMQTKEIERIKELSIVDSQQSQEIIIELNKEIERLNNIIKILDNYVIGDRMFEYGDTREEAEQYLQELKGSDK